MIKPLKEPEINASSRATVEKINELAEMVNYHSYLIARLAAGTPISMADRDRLLKE